MEYPSLSPISPMQLLRASKYYQETARDRAIFGDYWGFDGHFRHISGIFLGIILLFLVDFLLPSRFARAQGYA